MNKPEKIPFLDLITPHEELKEELCAGFEKALMKGAFVGGAAVEGFEKDFAQFCYTETASAWAAAPTPSVSRSWPRA